MKTSRMIAYVPALAGLYAMPENYPAAVTRDDATHDSAICGARAELDVLRGSSVLAQEMARDTAAIGYEGTAAEQRVERAEMALDALETAWGDALRAADSGDVVALREALEDALRIEREWGDSSQSREALEMLDRGAESAEEAA